MIEKDKTLFSTGEFAGFCNVSKQTLIYYDNIGLFSPEYIDAKGYRKYSLAQYEIFMVLTLLRELGTPLADIKKYIANRSPENFIKLMDVKEQSIKKEIKRLKDLLSMVKVRSKLAREGQESCNKEKMEIVYCEKQYLITTEYVGNLTMKQHLPLISEFDNIVLKSKNIGSPFGVILNQKDLLAKRYNEVSFFYVKARNKYKTVKTHIRPEGLYATTVHAGNYDNFEKTFEKLIKFISDNGYVITGNAYEEDLIDCSAAIDENDYVSKVSIQVEKTNRP